MPVRPDGDLLADTEPASRGFRRLKIAGVVVLVAGVALEAYGRPWYRQYQHRRQIRAEFATEHAKDCAESWHSVETALHRYEDAHRRLLDQLAAEDTDAVINRDVPDHLTKAAALHDSLIHARAICPAQADPARETTESVLAIDGVDVRDLY
jgi:hypothetical protein